MPVCVGIKLGSSYSCVAVGKDVDNELPLVETIANEDGDRVTPSIVAAQGNEFIFGYPARQELTRNPSKAVLNVKTLVGKMFDDSTVEKYNQRVGANCLESEGFPLFRLSFQPEEQDSFEKSFSPEEIVSHILTRLKTTAEAYCGDQVHAAVLSVPYHFNEFQRNCILKACRDINLQVLGLINEPTAAVLAYGIGQKPEEKHLDRMVLVFNLTSSGLDVSIVHVSNGFYSVVKSIHTDEVSGNLFDQTIFLHFVEDFKKKYRQDISQNPRACAKLLNASENVKRTLSTAQMASCHVDSLYDGIDFHSQIVRGKFENLSHSLFLNCKETVLQLLLEAGITSSQIDDVVLSGGCSSIPKIKTILNSIFSEGSVQTTIFSSINPDEVIANGAATQAFFFASEDPISQAEEPFYLPTLQSSIGIATADGVSFSIKKGTPLPVSRHFDFRIASGQESALIQIVEGESSIVSENKLLGEIALPDLADAENSNIRINFSLKENGALRITVQEPRTGKCVILAI